MNRRTTPTRTPTAGARRIAAIVAAIAATTAIAVACVPVTAPPSVLPRPDGQGIVQGIDVAPSSGCDAADPVHAGTSTVVISSGGVQRRATLSVPDDMITAAPLLVSLHPFLAGADPWEAYSGLAQAAVERGYVVVSPTGSDPGPRWAVPGGLDNGSDDIAFIAALTAHVEQMVCVDRNAEFAAGFSAGAAMAQALSCTMPWRFSAVAGSGGTNLTDTCADSPPTDVLILHGSADPIAPPTGSEVVFAPPLGLDVQDVATADAQRAGCDLLPTLSTPAPDVSAQTFGGCADDRRIVYWEMLGAGHTWAGAQPFPLDLVVGPTSQSFSATEVVLDFFDAA